MAGAGVLAAVLVLTIFIVGQWAMGWMTSSPDTPPPIDSMPDAPAPDNRVMSLPDE